MLDGWIISGILLFAVILVILIIGIGAIGMFLTEGTPPSEALIRSIKSVFGGGKGPKHPTFSIFFYPLAYLGMFFVTGILLTEVMKRISSGTAKWL